MPAAAPPAAVPTPTPTGWAPFSPEIGSRFASPVRVVRLVAITTPPTVFMPTPAASKARAAACRGRAKTEGGGVSRPAALRHARTSSAVGVAEVNVAFLLDLE